ncbi:MAG: hypothetical protein ACI8R0_003083, partial [Alteromonadales bacterium]
AKHGKGQKTLGYSLIQSVRLEQIRMCFSSKL